MKAVNTEPSSISCPADIPALPRSDEVLERIPTPVLLVDAQGRIQYRNRAAGLRLPDGATLQAVFARACFYQPVNWMEWLDRALAGSAARLDCTLESVESEAVPAAIRGAVMPADRGRGVRSVVLTVEPSCSHRFASEGSDVSQRLASLGKLAARVAHELNNPLDGILRYINLALRLSGDDADEKIKTYLTECRTGLKRMVHIIGDLLEFSRSGDHALEEVDVNEVVEQAIKAHAADADASNVALTADYQCLSMPVVSGSRLYQVCSNLLRNAIDMMPHGGRVSVTTGVVDDEVVIRVADTGPGLPDPPEKVFEPFFTTKKAGEGTGLGLAICKDFVESMRGTITAHSPRNGGAVFVVRLPRTAFRKPEGRTVDTRPTRKG